MKIAFPRNSIQYQSIACNADARIPALLLGLTAWLMMSIGTAQTVLGG